MDIFLRLWAPRLVAIAAALPTWCIAAQIVPADPAWTSTNRYRVPLTVDARDRRRSNSPASVEIDFQSLLPDGQEFDEHTVEVVALDLAGQPKVFDDSRRHAERPHVPHRLDRLYGSSTVTLNFVIPDHTCTKYMVYFDAVASGRVQHQSEKHRYYHGLVGDGDRFRENQSRRQIAASHFDEFVDFDGDGDLDLFQGGVEPYVFCYENVGGNRLVDRGRMASGGKLFALPHSKANRSWMSVAFYDIDDDGDQDFFPSFNDGPDAGRVVFYRNVTPRNGAALNFQRIGPLRTDTGTALAGGPQAGGWFPAIRFVKDWDGGGSGRLDALIGSNHRCWLYRGSGTNADGSPRFNEAEAVKADGREINLINPRFDCADIDGDGDLDLFAGTQPGGIWQFENTGTRKKPQFAAGRIIALDGKYLIGDAHSGLKIADFDGDGLLDLACGRFWERTDLHQPVAARDFGGFYRNEGTRTAPRLVRSVQGAPFTEQYQICDAVRQNCVRAIDWDEDGRLDLLAGDTDGFIWYFRNQSSQRFPLFASGEKLRTIDGPLDVTTSGGHARFDLFDWNNDGQPDLLVADGHGTLTLFRGESGKPPSAFAAGEKLLAGGKPIQHGARASVLVCDWDNDGRQDLVLADDKGYYWRRNLGTEAEPKFSDAKVITFGGKPPRYVRPNLGSFVDWDGDGRRDFIACEFENNVRFYRNLQTKTGDAEPQFADAEGVVILSASSPQMISGAHAVDWNGDGDLDLLTGQGHGGSGLRYFERDWLEDELHGTHPLVTAGPVEKKPANQ